MKKNKLKSEKISTKSPMSFTGFTSRYWRVTSTKSPTLRVVMMLPRLAVLICMWAVLAIWNLAVWGLFFWITLFWRFYRSGVRRDKRAAAQHREMLAAMGDKR